MGGETMFVQVRGRKGFILADPRSMPRWREFEKEREVPYEDRYSILRKELCQVFTESETQCPPSKGHGPGTGGAVVNITHCCTTEAGEAIFFPRTWWHGTCNRDPWVAGFPYIMDGHEDEEHEEHEEHGMAS